MSACALTVCGFASAHLLCADSQVDLQILLVTIYVSDLLERHNFFRVLAILKRVQGGFADSVLGGFYARVLLAIVRRPRLGLPATAL